MTDEVFLPWGTEERKIFKFHDGTKARAVDPITALKALQGIEGLALEADLTLASAEDAGEEFTIEANKATARLVAAVRQVFKVPDVEVIEGGAVTGLTDTECMALMTRFGTYLGEIAAAARPFAKSPTSSPGSTSETQATPSSSDAGSTGTS